MLLLDGRKDQLIDLDTDTLSSSTVVGSLISGLNPTSIVSHSSSLYLASTKTKSLYLINSTDPDDTSGSYGLIGKFPSGVIPISMASDGTNIYLIDSKFNRLYTVNTTTPSSSTYVDIPSNISALSIAFHSSNCYIGTHRDKSLYLINPSNPSDTSGSYGLIGKFPSGTVPMALGSDGTDLFMADSRLDRLYEVDTTTPSSSTYSGDLIEGISPLDLE